MFGTLASFEVSFRDTKMGIMDTKHKKKKKKILETVRTLTFLGYINSKYHVSLVHNVCHIKPDPQQF